jgi:uncharacterized membrane protein
MLSVFDMGWLLRYALGMETKINTSLAVCFALFVLGLVSVGANLISALAAALLFAPLLVAFFVGPAVVIASLLHLLPWHKRQAVQPISREERMD